MVDSQYLVGSASPADGGAEKWGHYGREKGAGYAVTLWPAADAIGTRFEAAPV
jgi:hypothetical protein